MKVQCYQRFTFLKDRHNCVQVAVADTGPNSARTINERDVLIQGKFHNYDTSEFSVGIDRCRVTGMISLSSVTPFCMQLLKLPASADRPNPQISLTVVVHHNRLQLRCHLIHKQMQGRFMVLATGLQGACSAICWAAPVYAMSLARQL